MLRNEVLPPEQACQRQNFSLSWLAENASSAERTQCPCSLSERGVSCCQGWRAVLCQHLPFGSALALTSTPVASDRNTLLSPDAAAGATPALPLTERCSEPAHGSNADWTPSLLGRWPAWRGWCRERFWCVKFNMKTEHYGGRKRLTKYWWLCLHIFSQQKLIVNIEIIQKHVLTLINFTIKD